MGLLEVLTVGVGTGVAKGILKVWLKENPVTAAIGESLLDVIRGLTEEEIEQRKANKQFKQVATKVAESVKVIVETKYPGIPKDRKESIAIAAGVTVDTTEFSAELFAKANLSPDELLKLFLLKSGADGGHPPLSGRGDKPAPPEECNLYRAILSEAAQLIVDGASQYPNYSKAVFSELLQGQDEHVRKINLILNEVQRIRDGQPLHITEYSEFDEKYRRAAIRRLDELQLFGIDVASGNRRYRLSTAYISLLVERQSMRNEEARGSLLKDDGEEDSRESVRVERALAQSSRIFLRGAPGSGKTTLLQWVAVTCSARNLSEDLSEWNDFVPFFIRLREFAQRDLPSPDDFAALISESLETAPVGWVRSQLESGQAIVLVDGLDELPPHRKGDVRNWLRDITAEYGKARYVLSSRPTAAQEGWLEPLGFLDAELRDMTSSDIVSFIAHWHDAAREMLRDPEKIRQIDELEAALEFRIRKSPAIFKLTKSPLLCAVVCALHRDRLQNIPDDRIELYEACIDMFLRRDQERRIELPQFSRLSNRQARALLSDLAYWFVRNGVSLADVDDIDDRLQRKLEDFRGVPEGTTGTLVRKGFVARSGILQEPSSGKVNFPHRTFQEYLAAREIVDERDFGVLIKNVDDQQNWRETIILAAGLSNQSEAETIIFGLLEKFDNNREIEILLLATGCLETAVSIADRVRIQVEGRLRKFVPPNNLSDARTLANAGDLIVPYLVNLRDMKHRQAAASATTLAMIDSQMSRETLAREAADDPRPSVLAVVVKGVDYANDPTDYLEAMNIGVRWSFLYVNERYVMTDKSTFYLPDRYVEIIGEWEYLESKEVPILEKRALSHIKRSYAVGKLTDWKKLV